MGKYLNMIAWALRSPFAKSKSFYQGPNGKTVKILANGPSLADDLGNLVETDAVSVLNFFILHDIFWSVKPQYYVLADPVLFMDASPVANVDKLYELVRKIDWDITFLVPLEQYDFFKRKTQSNPHVCIKTFYRSFLAKRLPAKCRFRWYQKGLSTPYPQNVLIPSIAMMLNEGFEKIYLYGAGHSWTTQMAVDEENRLCLVDNHFYDQGTDNKRLWLNPERPGQTFKMHEILACLQTAFATYHELKAYAGYLGKVQIINKDKHSFIDAFVKE